MKLIGENLHIISKTIQEALIKRDKDFFTELIKKEATKNLSWIDLNIGPAKKNLEGSMSFLVNLAQEVTQIPLSLDSTNILEIESGLKQAKNPQSYILNSTSADEEKLHLMTDLAAFYKSNLIALTLNKEIGIPKTADERLGLAFEIVEIANEKEIDNEKLFFDPLILPVCVDQSQAAEALNAIRMFKESFDPPVNTTIGLSNVSNGCPKNLRPLVNQVFFTLAYGCGLDSAIVDAFDDEISRINSMLENSKPQTSYDNLLISLVEMIETFGDLKDIRYDKNDLQQVKIYKTAEILMNKKIYSHSYLEI